MSPPRRVVVARDHDVDVATLDGSEHRDEPGTFYELGARDSAVREEMLGSQRPAPLLDEASPFLFLHFKRGRLVFFGAPPDVQGSLDRCPWLCSWPSFTLRRRWSPQPAVRRTRE